MLIKNGGNRDDKIPVKRQILVLFAHPLIERSEVNRPLAQATSKMNDVTLVDLYAEYPDFSIDIDNEQARLLAHDVIIFMYPLYWYSTPSILKEWQDLVLEHNFAYGAKGTTLNGKIFFSALTAGGSEAGYSAEGYNHFTLRELLRPLEQMAVICGMIYLPPFALFSACTAVDEGRVSAHIDDWIRVLTALQNHQFDIETARHLPKLNNHLDVVIQKI